MVRVAMGAALSALLCAEAAAQPSVTPKQPSPPPVELKIRSYRAPILMRDLIGGGLMLAGIAASDEYGAFLLVGIGGAIYVLGSPFVHSREGQDERGMLSLGLRLGLLVAGANLVGSATGESDDKSAWGGALIGAVIATTIDLAFLAEKVEARPVVYTAPSRDGGLTFGIAGRF